MVPRTYLQLWRACFLKPPIVFDGYVLCSRIYINAPANVKLNSTLENLDFVIFCGEVHPTLGTEIILTSS